MQAQVDRDYERREQLPECVRDFAIDSLRKLHLRANALQAEIRAREEVLSDVNQELARLDEFLNSHARARDVEQAARRTG